MENQSCVFCIIAYDKIILKNDLAFVINNKYPHSKGHILVIPFVHTEKYFDLTEEVQTAMLKLLNKIKIFTDNKYNPIAYNVSINIGKAAGQIDMHSHIHLIPRYN